MRLILTFIIVIICNPLFANIYFVTESAGNDSASNSCGIPGSFLAALCDAKSNSGKDTIEFKLNSGHAVSSVHKSITINDSELFINAYLESSGDSLSLNFGLQLNGSKITLNQILFQGNDSSVSVYGGNNIISNSAFLNNNADGIIIFSKNNIIENNTISQNKNHGIILSSENATGNELYGNHILANDSNGITIIKGASNNIVGKVDGGNVINGNYSGILVHEQNGSTTTKNTLRYNSFSCNRYQGITIVDPANYFNNECKLSANINIEKFEKRSFSDILRGQCFKEVEPKCVLDTIIVDYYSCDSVCVKNCYCDSSELEPIAPQGFKLIATDTIIDGECLLNTKKLDLKSNNIFLLFTEYPPIPGKASTSNFKKFCYGSDTVLICDIPHEIGIQGTSIICEGEESVLNALADPIFYGVDISHVRFDWYLDGVLIESITGNSYYLANQTGQYHAVITDTNFSGETCTSVTNDFFVNVQPYPNLLLPNVTLCDGIPYTVNVPEFYELTINGSKINTITEAGIYTYQYWVMYSPCSTSGQFTAKVQPLPSVNIDTNQTVCLGNKLILDAGTDTLIIKWLPTGETTSKIEVNSAGTYTLNLTDKKYSCTKSYSVHVQTANPIEANLEGMDSLCKSQGETVNLKVEPNVSKDGSYTWLPNLGNGNEVVFSDAGWIKVSFIDENNCLHKDSMLVIDYCVNDTVVINPDSIPGNNKDISNIIANYLLVFSDFQELEIARINGEIPVGFTSHLMIYNRWGLLLHESNNYPPSWDGFYNAKPVADGVYYWVWRYGSSDEKQKFKNGFFHLIQRH